MNMVTANRFLAYFFRVFCVAVALAATSAWASFVTWDLNPDQLNQNVGSADRTYTVDNYSITAHGFDNNNGFGTPHELFYKFTPGDDTEHGLGIVGTPNNELQVAGNGSPLNFIQFGLSSILQAGFLHGQISVGSVQNGELWSLYGSNTLGTLGTLLNSTPYGHETDAMFVDIPDFGSYQFISVVAVAFDVLPVALRATPIPEASSLLPAAVLVIGVTAFEIRRRRRAAA
jgi:hypothetical protein